MVVRGIARHVVAVIGGQRRNVQRAADLQQPVADPLLDGQAVVHQLQEVVVGAEDLPPLRRGLQRLALLTEPQPGLHLPGRATGGGDNACGVLGDQLGVHPRPLAQLAFEGSQRRQLEQVAQAGGVLGHHGQVRVGAAAGHVVALLPRIAPQDATALETRSGRDVGLDADDRFDTRRGGPVVKLAGAEHVAVVGHPDRGHLQPLRLGEHRRDLRGTVQHRILGVVMQVHERLTHRDASLWPHADASPACRRVCLATVPPTHERSATMSGSVPSATSACIPFGLAPGSSMVLSGASDVGRESGLGSPSIRPRGDGGGNRDGHQFACPTSTAMAGTVMVRPGRCPAEVRSR